MKKTSVMRRVLAMLFAVVMLLSCGAAAYAAETEDEEPAAVQPTDKPQDAEESAPNGETEEPEKQPEDEPQDAEDEAPDGDAEQEQPDAQTPDAAQEISEQADNSNGGGENALLV